MSPARKTPPNDGPHNHAVEVSGAGASVAEDRLWTPQEVAAYLSVPVRTLYAWRCRGEGPPGRRVGKHLRYRRADVDAWLERQS